MNLIALLLLLSAPQDPDWSRRIVAVDPGSNKEAWAKLDFSSEHWKKMELPIHFEKAGLPDYDGVVWFRKQLALPNSVKGQKAVLRLGPIDDMDVTWVNGKRVGGYEKPGHHYTPRVYAIPTGVLQDGKNVIAVRVLDHGWPGGIAGRFEVEDWSSAVVNGRDPDAIVEGFNAAHPDRPHVVVAEV